MLISFLLFACNEKEIYPSSTQTDPTTQWDVNPQPESEPAEEPASEPAEEPASEPSEEPEDTSEPTEEDSFCSLFTETCGTWSLDTVCEDWYNGAPTGTEGDSSGATQSCYDYHLDVASQQTEQSMIDSHCAHAIGIADADGNAPCVDTAEETSGLTIPSTALDVGSVDLGASIIGTLSVTNDAASDITLSTLSFSDTAFAVSAASSIDAGSVLAAGSTSDLEVEFTPAMAQSYSATLTITSDSTITPELVIDLTGEGVEVTTSNNQLDANHSATEKSDSDSQ